MPNAPKALLAAALLALLGACASPSMYAPEPPILSGLDVARGPAPSLRNAIAVGSVILGPDGGQPWRGNVSAADIQATLARTLAEANLGGTAAGGRFRLDGALLTLQRPYAGFAMTVTAQIAWRLTDGATGAVVYDQTLTSLGSASLDDAITNETRLRIADERAVRANLRMLVEALYALPEPRQGPRRG
ncbi:MAG: hypothetical protein U1E23_03650 [Reyranellaceae bacterium]